MKRSQVLLQQHAGRMFRDKWKVQRKKILVDNGALKELRLRGIPFEDANDVIKEKTQESLFELENFPPRVLMFDESHPDYHEKSCFMYSDHNVLLGGLDQAMVFTNSCEMELDKLPLIENVKEAPSESDVHNIVKRYIKASLLFDATQEKLPKRKDPERPAFIFPRDYGITDKRKNFLLGKRLLQLCFALSPQLINQRRLIAGPINFQACLKRNENNILLSSVANEMITSDVNITPIIDPAVVQDKALPDIFPLSSLISFERPHFYKFNNIFPINENVEKSHVHTILIHFDKTEVSNLYETEVTETQILGRSLMKSYTVALAQARHTFGKEILDLPKPITLQCVQMDSKTFHFSILQLNTTGGPDETATRNAYWNISFLPLFENCDYVDGKPELNGYNSLVFNTLLAFVKNS